MLQLQLLLLGLSWSAGLLFAAVLLTLEVLPEGVQGSGSCRAAGLLKVLLCRLGDASSAQAHQQWMRCAEVAWVQMACGADAVSAARRGGKEA